MRDGTWEEREESAAVRMEIPGTEMDTGVGRGMAGLFVAPSGLWSYGDIQVEMLKRLSKCSSGLRREI